MLNIHKLLIGILFFTSVSLSGQVLPPEKPKDTTKTSLLKEVLQVKDTLKIDSLGKLPYTFNSNQKGSLFLNKYANFEVIYDPETSQYIFVEKVGDYYIKHPFYMSKKEYEEYRLRRDMMDYFKEKVSAIGGRQKDKELAQKNLLPKYYVKSELFENIFGGNEIEVNPQGSVLVKMGVLFQKVENPQLSERNRQSTTFDFDQEINASLNARVGKRLTVNANFDTQATFNFQNLIKLDYTPTEDDIIRKIEVGNVSMPIQSSLISGAQNLFGVKTELQFGRTTITGVFSQQRSQTRSVAAQGGATITEFEMRASDYDDNRHFFLSQSFRDDFNKALKEFPLINSSKYVTRIEVWITNRNNTTEDVRNIVALADLGEADPNNIHSLLVTSNGGPDPRNDANSLNGFFADGNPIRDISTVNTAMTGYNQGTDYSLLENARKLTLGVDFTLNPQLGYITLNRKLADSDILAVAFEYTDSNTTGDNVFRVGELSSDGITAPSNLIVKLLRSEIVNTKIPMWKLMMKNIYALQGGYQLNPDGFRLEVLYQDDKEGVPLNILQNAVTSEEIKTASLLRMMRIDRLDATNQKTETSGSFAAGDGFFDFLPGLTVDTQYGYIIFPTVEPFGNSLSDTPDPISTTSGELGQILTVPADQQYVFDELYNLTKAQAKNEFQNKDKYFLKGYFKSESSSGIPLGAFNVPRGSVTVTSGGRELLEGVDYVVDYTMGTVQIIDPNLAASNAPINVSVENNNGFNQQRRSFIGVDIQHIFSEDFAIGGTILNLNERPFTQKYQFGSEPVNNTIVGVNLSYKTEVPKLTKWVNKLPNIETDVPSNFSIRAEAAYLLPGSPKGINLNGEAASYVDDFEGSQIPLDMSAPRQWFLASVPKEQDNPELDFITNNNIPVGMDSRIRSGAARSKLAWYTIDRLFYGNTLKPSNITDNELSRDEVRRIGYDELFPELDLDVTQSNIVNTFDLAYYPEERGPYNFTTDANSDGTLTNPEQKWAGIMRSLNTTDFQQANIEYIQFWLMDPYQNYSITQEEGASNINPADFGGELYFNLGNISEDILDDDRRMYENGLPADGVKVYGNNVDQTSAMVDVPKTQSLLYAFTEKDNERPNQDLGLDGLTDAEELQRFGTQFGSDPSNDNYQFYRGSELDASDATILARYKNYNNTQGNSPTINNSTESYPTSATSYPDVEDINKDQTMSDVESYFQYKVSLNPSDLIVGQNNIVDRKEMSVTLANGNKQTAVWYQFRIPINSPDEVINEISDFNSIRFMRIFLTKFRVPVVLRFGELQLVRGDWRRYTKTLDETINPPQELDADENRNFEVGVVNIQENENKQPIPYVLPPGVRRERLQGTTTIQEQNEQSLLVRVNDLEAGQTRAVYKNTSFDMRMFNKLKMFIHAESITGKGEVADDELSAIIRLGSDTDDNFYQVEVPLKITPSGSISDETIWPSENELMANLKEFGQLKIERYTENASQTDIYPSYTSDPETKLRVKGNPNLSNIRTIMIGVKNNSISNKSAELWFNELRVVDFDNKGGWAAVVNADANFADFADISISGRANSQGFGSIDQRVSERSQEDVKQYDIVTNINLGQLLPKSAGIQLPFNYSISEEFRDPKWDAKYQDVLFEDAKEANANSDKSRDYTKRRSINLINVRKERTDPEKPQRIYDVENLSVSYSYNDTYHRDFNVEKYLDQNVRAAATYNYSFTPMSIEPFKKSKFLEKNKFFAFIKDFNINPLPTSISVNSNIIRSYNEQLSRPLVDDPSFPEIPTLTQRRFMFDWDYNIAYNLTKSLQFTFRATNNHIYDNFDTDNDIRLFTNFFNIGRPNQYHQTLDATYKVPINKIPWFDFITTDYKYSADFNWQAGAQDYIDDIGNTIRNANTHGLNADIDLTRLYDKTGLSRLAIKKPKTKKSDKKAKKEDNTPQQPTINRSKPGITDRDRKKLSPGRKVVQGLIDAVTSVKKIRFSYIENNETTLPGYKPEVGFLGRDNYSGSLAPTLGFVFGSQRDIRSIALANDWLVSRPHVDSAYYSRAYSTTHYEKLDINADVRPFKDLSIELTGNRIYVKNQSQQMDIINGQFNENLPTNKMGNFSISYFMLPNAFDGDGDATFEKFKQNRTVIQQRLAAKYGVAASGFSENGQQVLLPAFLATYSGQSANKVGLRALRDIPIPNWRLNYKGLMNFAWFKKHFRSFTVEHGYRATYSIIGYNSNLQYDPEDQFSNPINGNYQPSKIYSGINLIEEFSPLVKVDMRLKNSFSLKAELKTDKMFNLNINNNTLTENRGKEYIVGLGYRFKDVQLRMKTGTTTTTFKGDINLKADFTLRDDSTIIRSIDIDNNQVTGGQKLIGFKFDADYALNKNLLASFFYYQNSSRFLISSTFPRKSVNAGISLRYTIGN